MPSVQIKHVPDDVHAELRRRARVAGQSLQEFLLSQLIQTAQDVPLDAVLERAGSHRGGHASIESVTHLLHAERDAR